MAPAFCFASAKIGFLSHTGKFLFKKISAFKKFDYLCIRNDLNNRDVAQLVAYYVRDVGVGRSNRLIPTNLKLRN